MSDELEIRSGGVIAVDTDRLREAAARLLLLSDDGDRLGSVLAAVGAALGDARAEIFLPTVEAASASEGAASLADGLRAMAETYDLVELWIRIEAAQAANDLDRAVVLRALSAQLIAAHPGVAARAAGAIAGWVLERRSGVVAQMGAPPGPVGYLAPGWALRAVAAGMGGALALAGTVAVDAFGRGAARDTPLRGSPRPVTVTPVETRRGSAPTGLADIARRIPRGDGRVRVEKYAMADGSVRFVAYVAGTQIGAAGDEPWDMASNLELYTGSRSASYDATMAALEAAGARPGDSVILAGHSQGAMVASHVAASGVYDVPALVTLGDPVQVAVGDGTLSVDIRHDDDPVAALASGGHPGPIGAEGSVVVARSSAASLATGESPMAPHALTRYTETATLLDASRDPRMDGIRARIHELDGAVSVQVTVYGARRPPDG